MLIQRAFDRIRSLWHGRVGGFGTQTYEGARAEMGGAPWLPAPKSTDAWFIIDDQAAAAGAQAERQRIRSRVLMITMSAATVIVIAVALVAPRQHAAPPIPAPIPAVIPAAIPAAAAAPVVAPEPVATAVPQAAAAPAEPAPVRSHAHAKGHHAHTRKHR